MYALFHTMHDAAVQGGFADRRSFPRLDKPLFARIRCRHALGSAWSEVTTVRNLSAQGLLVALPLPVMPATPIFVLVNLWNGTRHDGRGLVLAARATVLRCELAKRSSGDGRGQNHDEQFLVAARFRRHRLLTVDRTRWTFCAE